MAPTKSTHTPVRNFRVPDDLWRRYGEVVGQDQRSADLRAYVEWRVEHPDVALPVKASTRRGERSDSRAGSGMA